VNVSAGTSGWPDPAEVDVWVLRLDASASVSWDLEKALSAEERARAERFVFPADRHRYVAAHALLREILAGYAGRFPSQMRFEHGPGGKPRLVHAEHLRFNLSHSGNVGMVAVTFAREVGIDVEALRPIPDLDVLATKCFSAAERAQFASIPEPSRLEAFLEGWTRKEAFLKALGEGLLRPLDSFDVTLRPGDPPRILWAADDPGMAARYSLRSLRPAPGFVGALAVEGREPRVRLRGRVHAETDGPRMTRLARPGEVTNRLAATSECGTIGAGATLHGAA
jgi:4'-phosphopantetheinyl transferase